MAIARVLREIRLTLSAGIMTAVTPPVPSSRCMVGNASGADVLFYTNDDTSANEYRTITNGYEREVRGYAVHSFRADEVAFWLKSTPGGLVILEWS